MTEEEKIPMHKPNTAFNRRLSVAEKLKIIKYAEENSIHASSNLYGVSRTIIRYWMEGRRYVSRLSRIRKGSQTIQIENEQGSDQQDEYITSSGSADYCKFIYFKDFNHRIYKLNLKVLVFCEKYEGTMTTAK